MSSPNEWCLAQVVCETSKGEPSERHWNNSPKRSAQIWFYKPLQQLGSLRGRGRMNVTTPLESLLVEGKNCGSRPAGFWIECHLVKFNLMCSRTVLQSMHVRKVVNGSEHWAYLRRCFRQRSVLTSSATTQQSVPLKRVVNGSRHWASWMQWHQQTCAQMWLATMQQSVHVKRLVNGTRL